MSSIDLPLDAIAAPPEDREPIVRQELTVSLYRGEHLSFRKSRELAGISKAELHQLLGERGVERHYTRRISRSTSSARENDGHLEQINRLC